MGTSGRFWNPKLVKRLAWGLIAVGSGCSLWAVWLGLHLKEAPGSHSTMMQFLTLGVGLYMVGRLILVSLRWAERRRSREDQ